MTQDVKMIGTAGFVALLDGAARNYFIFDRSRFSRAGLPQVALCATKGNPSMGCFTHGVKTPLTSEIVFPERTQFNP